MAQVFCFHCKTSIPWDPSLPVSRRDSCPKCGCDVRACLNCRHYDRSARSECREEISEPVRDKEKANLCDSFQARDDNGQQASGTAAPAKENLLSAAEALFKKK